MYSNHVFKGLLYLIVEVSAVFILLQQEIERGDVENEGQRH
jgi:hypothetical protein